MAQIVKGRFNTIPPTWIIAAVLIIYLLCNIIKCK